MVSISTSTVQQSNQPYIGAAIQQYSTARKMRACYTINIVSEVDLSPVSRQVPLWYFLDLVSRLSDDPADK
jgi:hypothetical protein